MCVFETTSSTLVDKFVGWEEDKFIEILIQNFVYGSDFRCTLLFYCSGFDDVLGSLGPSESISETSPSCLAQVLNISLLCPFPLAFWTVS